MHHAALRAAANCVRAKWRHSIAIAAQAIATAEEIVAQAVAEFLAGWRERQIAPLIVSLRSQAEEICQAEVTKTLARLNLTPDQRQVLDTLVSSLTNKLLYASIHKIKSALSGHGYPIDGQG